MKAIGIDLGTTNSVAAIYDGKVAKVLMTKENEVLTPSVVGYRKPLKNREGQILVGRVAVNNAGLAPRDTIYSIKRLMGRIYGDPKIQELKEKVGYQIVPPSNAGEEQGVRVLLNGSEYSPVDISALILKNIKEYAEYRLGEEVTHAVITVPAYFEERQRAATRAAGEQAGLVVKMILSEPVAAALAFGLEAAQDKGRRVLVFDLGGGTFDISIIQMFGDQAQVMYHGGDNWLGGDDFDREIINAIIRHVIEEEKFDPSKDPEFLARAKAKAQEAKIALGASDEYEIILSPAGQKQDGASFIVNMVITREEFETMIRKYVDRCIELTREALRDQELTQEDITDVLLVGGSTAVPLVQKRLQEEFRAIGIKTDINPMECVALGASILAVKLRGIECPQCFEADKPSQHTLNDESATVCQKCGASLAAARPAGEGGYYDITAMHLGVRAVQGDNLDAFVPIIYKGTSFPLSEPKRRTFYTTEENQKLIKVPVFEGLHPLARQNDQQGIIEWQLPDGLPINTPVEVAFNYDRSRTLAVTLRVMGRDGLEHAVVLQRDRPMEIIDIAEPVENIDWREDTEGIIPAAEQFLQLFGSYIKEGTVAKMQRTLDRLRTALDENNETQGRAAAQEIWLFMAGGAGIASQLYLAERAVEGAPPDVGAEIQAASEQLRLAYEAGADQGALQNLVGGLKTKVAQQIQAAMTREAVGDKVNYEQLLRYKE
jgi:molecular chaperone DnaK